MPHWASLNQQSTRRLRELRMDLPQPWTTQVQQHKEVPMLALMVTIMKAVPEANTFMLDKWLQGCLRTLWTNNCAQCVAVGLAASTSTFCSVRSWERWHQRRQEHCTTTWVLCAKSATLSDTLVNVASFNVWRARLKSALDIGKVKFVGVSGTTPRFIRTQRPREKHFPKWATVL